MAEPTPERRRELLGELTQQAIEAGTYDQPAPEMRPPVAEHTPQEDCSLCGDTGIVPGTESPDINVTGEPCDCQVGAASPVAAEGLLRACLVDAELAAHVEIMPDGHPSVIAHSNEQAADRAIAVLAELVGDPGDLPKRMATAMHAADCGCDDGHDGWYERLAIAAFNVRDEHLLHLEARAEYAEGQLRARRDHEAHWEREKARADKAEQERDEAQRERDAKLRAMAWDTSCVEHGRLLDAVRTAEEQRDAARAQVAALREELAVTKQAIYNRRMAHVRDAHPTRLLVGDCAVCREFHELSRALPARPDDPEEIRRLAESTEQ